MDPEAAGYRIDLSKECLVQGGMLLGIRFEVVNDHPHLGPTSLAGLKILTEDG